MFFSNARPKTDHYSIPTAFVLLLSLATMGCSGDDEIAKYGIQGMVSLDGELVSTASLRFTPDAKSGTKGPQAFALAKEGFFDVDAEQGLVAGVFDVTVELVDETGSVIGTASQKITVTPDADNAFDFTINSADLKAVKADGDADSEEEGDVDED